MRPYFSEQTRVFIAQRAGFCCEYCRLHRDDLFLPFQIDHIISLKHGGGHELENLAYVCPHCNQHKGSDLATFLDSYQDIAVLFNPRTDIWAEHFEVAEGEILPKTRTGRATIKMLRFNEPDLLILRRSLFEEGRYPR
ncbi:MAG: HNH endonuclease [Saprospiraceae bacterium]